MPQPSRLLALGDSLTVATGFSGVTDETGYVPLVQRELLARQLNVELHPSALDGVDTGYVLRRFDRLVTSFAPDWVWVLLGLNDAKPPGQRPALSPPEFARNLRELVERILNLDAKPVLVTPPPRSEFPGTCPLLSRAFMEPYAAAVRATAADYHLSCVELYDRFLARPNWPQFFPDGLHPNPSGHRVIADALLEWLLPTFRVPPSDPVLVENPRAARTTS